MTTKPKRAPKLPKASLLERLDRPTGPDLRPELLSSVLSSLNPQIKAIEDLKLDIDWLKASMEGYVESLRNSLIELNHSAKPRLWPLWTMLIVELVGLAYLFAKVYGLAPVG